MKMSLAETTSNGSIDSMSASKCEQMKDNSIHKLLVMLLHNHTLQNTTNERFRILPSFASKASQRRNASISLRQLLTRTLPESIPMLTLLEAQRQWVERSIELIQSGQKELIFDTNDHLQKLYEMITGGRSGSVPSMRAFNLGAHYVMIETLLVLHLVYGSACGQDVCAARELSTRILIHMGGFFIVFRYEPLAFWPLYHIRPFVNMLIDFLDSRNLTQNLDFEDDHYHQTDELFGQLWFHTNVSHWGSDPPRVLTMLNNQMLQVLELLDIDTDNLKMRNFYRNYSTDQWNRSFHGIPYIFSLFHSFRKHLTIPLYCHVFIEMESGKSVLRRLLSLFQDGSFPLRRASLECVKILMVLADHITTCETVQAGEDCPFLRELQEFCPREVCAILLDYLNYYSTLVDRVSAYFLVQILHSILGTPLIEVDSIRELIQGTIEYTKKLRLRLIKWDGYPNRHERMKEVIDSLTRRLANLPN